MRELIRTNDAVLISAVEALLTSTRTNSRKGAGQPMASEVVSTFERMAAPLAKAIPVAARISPSCR